MTASLSKTDKETPVNADSATARADVLAELQALRSRIRPIEGSVVATTDGMVVAHDLSASGTFGIEPEGVAALCAVNLGLSQRIADTASHGVLHETIIRGAFGQVVTYPAGERALIAILIGVADDLGELHVEARKVADRVAVLLADMWQDDAFIWQA